MSRQERKRNSVTPPNGVVSTRDSFADRVSRLHAGLVRDGVPIADMRRSPALELQFAGVGELGRAPAQARAAGGEPIEGPIAARLVPTIPPRESRLRYF